MSVFRPRNINKRLVGTASTAQSGSSAGSPGNAGQIGPTKTPYCLKGTCASAICLGSRFFNGGSSCAGVFRTNESRCGRQEGCNCPFCDCKGFFVCCGPTTNKWFVAPSCTQLCRNWASRSDSSNLACTCMGDCGWFVPTVGQMSNLGTSCKTYWDNFTNTTSGTYWTSTDQNTCNARIMNIHNGSSGSYNPDGAGTYKTHPFSVRAFRCTA